MQNGPTPALDREARLAALARRQHGVVSATQLPALGFSRGAIQHRRSTWRLTDVHRGVFAVGAAPLTRDARAMAAVLASGAGAVLSHRSAAVLHGLLGGDGVRWDVTAPCGGGRSGPGTVRLHRSRRLGPDDVTTIRGIPVTTIARTLIDVADDAPRLVAKAVHEAEVRRVLDVTAVREAVRRTPGRRGTAALRAALGPGGTAPGHGAFVAAYLRICVDYGVPIPEVSAWLELRGTWHEIDLLYRAERLIVELDGEVVHGTRRRFAADRRRDAGFAASGFLTVRSTWDRITGEPARVAHELLSILSRRAAP